MRLPKRACFSGATNDKSGAFLRRKLLLTIDAHSDGVKK
jgi:hypothetical protein